MQIWELHYTKKVFLCSVYMQYVSHLSKFFFTQKIRILVSFDFLCNVCTLCFEITQVKTYLTV